MKSRCRRMQIADSALGRKNGSCPGLGAPITLFWAALWPPTRRRGRPLSLAEGSTPGVRRRILEGRALDSRQPIMETRRVRLLVRSGPGIRRVGSPDCRHQWSWRR